MTESEKTATAESEPIEEPCPSLLERTMRALELTRGVEIARRYLAMNAFDGALTMLGIILGGLISMATLVPREVFNTTILAAFGTSMAMAISGFSGSYLTETAERDREVEEIGRSMLCDMSETMYAKATKITSVVVAIVDGMSPAVAALIVAIPLYLVPFGMLEILTAFYMSIVVCMILLFALGLFLGNVSGKSMLNYGLKTLLAGILTTIMMFLISLFTGTTV